MSFVGGKKRWLLGLASVSFILILVNLLYLTGADIRATINKVPIPGLHKGESLDSAGFELQYRPKDAHPISLLMEEADKKWRRYENRRSLTFQETVRKYRARYGRHPPPGFKEWYLFAREKNVHNIDDFDQIMDDLRPFWAVPPTTIRNYAAHLWEKKEDGCSGIHIRDHKVVKVNKKVWRSENFEALLKGIVKFLPDMDIALNLLDQPRVAVPWDDMQKMLSKEVETRKMHPEVIDGFTPHLPGLLDWELAPENDTSTRENSHWFNAPGKQYMDIAREACPPESHARQGVSTAVAEAKWKNQVGGLVTNFNLSSDLCTMGPELQDLHGFLYSSSSVMATKTLVPVFGECKVNINNDILFPANMYWMDDKRYLYNGNDDVNWNQKKDALLWRGVTSGGVQTADNWNRMHRQRLVRMFNSTVMNNEDVRILSEQEAVKGVYENYDQYNPSELLSNYSDVGFVESWGCSPNCSFYNDVFEWVPQVPLGKQFGTKYLIDVDGHSFSGRWRAFLQSRSLGIKATIFREWHDSRLFAWRHFVPMDNRYDDIYTIMTYFLGLGSREEQTADKPFVEGHDLEAKRLALQAQEWAHKVYRREDMEVRRIS